MTNVGLGGLSDIARDVTRGAGCSNCPPGEMVTLRPTSLSPRVEGLRLDSTSVGIKIFGEDLMSAKTECLGTDSGSGRTETRRPPSKSLRTESLRDDSTFIFLCKALGSVQIELGRFISDSWPRILLRAVRESALTRALLCSGLDGLLGDLISVAVKPFRMGSVCTASSFGQTKVLRRTLTPCGYWTLEGGSSSCKICKLSFWSTKLNRREDLASGINE